jgi:hypothetical protein
MNALFDPHFDQPVYTDGEPLDSARAAILLMHARAPQPMTCPCSPWSSTSPASLILLRRPAGSSWYPPRNRGAHRK